MNDIDRVSQFWDSARARVLEIAEAAGLDISLEEHDDEFLFDLFDYGDYEPTDAEIIEAIKDAENA